MQTLTLTPTKARAAAKAPPEEEATVGAAPRADTEPVFIFSSISRSSSDFWVIVSFLEDSFTSTTLTWSPMTRLLSTPACWSVCWHEAVTAKQHQLHAKWAIG